MAAMSATVLNTQGIIAIAAGGVAVVALLTAFYLALQLRRLRAAQSAVLGPVGKRDLVNHVLGLQTAFEGLQQFVEGTAADLHQRMEGVQRYLDNAISLRSLVRYDAYNEQSGRQSLSLALLDRTRSGVVITCIHHREQARVYAKQVVGGKGEYELSPEEEEAVELASPARDEPPRTRA